MHITGTHAKQKKRIKVQTEEGNEDPNEEEDNESLPDLDEPKAGPSRDITSKITKQKKQTKQKEKQPDAEDSDENDEEEQRSNPKSTGSALNWGLNFLQKKTKKQPKTRVKQTTKKDQEDSSASEQERKMELLQKEMNEIETKIKEKKAQRNSKKANNKEKSSNDLITNVYPQPAKETRKGNAKKKKKDVKDTPVPRMQKTTPEKISQLQEDYDESIQKFAKFRKSTVETTIKPNPLLQTTDDESDKEIIIKDKKVKFNLPSDESIIITSEKESASEEGHPAGETDRITRSQKNDNPKPSKPDTRSSKRKRKSYKDTSDKDSSDSDVPNEFKEKKKIKKPAIRDRHYKDKELGIDHVYRGSNKPGDSRSSRTSRTTTKKGSRKSKTLSFDM
jgi:hypothetical protein